MTGETLRLRGVLATALCVSLAAPAWPGKFTAKAPPPVGEGAVMGVDPYVEEFKQTMDSLTAQARALAAAIAATPIPRFSLMGAMAGGAALQAQYGQMLDLQAQAKAARAKMIAHIETRSDAKLHYGRILARPNFDGAGDDPNLRPQDDRILKRSLRPAQISKATSDDIRDALRAAMSGDSPAADGPAPGAGPGWSPSPEGLASEGPALSTGGARLAVGSSAPRLIAQPSPTRASAAPKASEAPLPRDSARSAAPKASEAPLPRDSARSAVPAPRLAAQPSSLSDGGTSTSVAQAGSIGQPASPPARVVAGTSASTPDAGRWDAKASSSAAAWLAAEAAPAPRAKSRKRALGRRRLAAFESNVGYGAGGGRVGSGFAAALPPDIASVSPPIKSSLPAYNDVPAPNAAGAALGSVALGGPGGALPIGGGGVGNGNGVGLRPGGSVPDSKPSVNPSIETLSNNKSDVAKVAAEKAEKLRQEAREDAKQRRQEAIQERQHQQQMMMQAAQAAAQLAGQLAGALAKGGGGEGGGAGSGGGGNVDGSMQPFNQSMNNAASNMSGKNAELGENLSGIEADKQRAKAQAQASNPHNPAAGDIAYVATDP